MNNLKEDYVSVRGGEDQNHHSNQCGYPSIHNGLSHDCHTLFGTFGAGTLRTKILFFFILFLKLFRHLLLP